MHQSKTDAFRHLDKKYGDVLCKISREISILDSKYSKIIDYIDNHLSYFQTLIDLKKDMNLEGEE